MATTPFGLPPLGEMFTGVVLITRVLTFHMVSWFTMCPHHPLPAKRISLFDYQVHSGGNLICLTCTTTSWMRRASSPEKGLLPDVVELYAGSGGMGLGAIFPGGQVKVSVDFNVSATQHVEANNYNHVKQLDLMMDLRCGGYMILLLVLPSILSSLCREVWTSGV